MMHEFCSHCDVRKTSLFEINQQLADQMENLRAENKNLESLLKYYESADVAEVVRCKDCEYSEEGFKVVLRDGILKREKVWLCSYYGTDEVPEEIVEENGYCSNGRRKENV